MVKFVVLEDDTTVSVEIFHCRISDNPEECFYLFAVNLPSKEFFSYSYLKEYIII